MESEKIKSPKTNRYIYINGDAYNKLITKDGYTQNYLLSLPRITSDKPMSPKYKKVVTTNNKINNINTIYLTGVDDANLQILRQTDNIYELCQINKYFYNLCMKNKDIKEKYFKQQKIHERLTNLFDFLEEYPLNHIKVVDKSKKLSMDFINNNVIPYYVKNVHYFYIGYKKDSYPYTFLLMKKLGSGYTNISKKELYQLLYDMINQNNLLNIFNDSGSAFYKSLKNKNINL